METRRCCWFSEKGTVRQLYPLQDTDLTTIITAATLNQRLYYSLLESHEATEAPPAEWIWNKRYGEFRTWGGSLSSNIWLGRGHRPPTAVGVRRLEWLPYRVVSKYPQSIILFCHNARVWRTDGLTELRQQYHALHYMHTAKSDTRLRLSCPVTTVKGQNMRRSVVRLHVAGVIKNCWK